jgi:hypothetical protein
MQRMHAMHAVATVQRFSVTGENGILSMIGARFASKFGGVLQKLIGDPFIGVVKRFTTGPG